jgi:hypothetical protein
LRIKNSLSTSFIELFDDAYRAARAAVEFLPAGIVEREGYEWYLPISPIDRVDPMAVVIKDRTLAESRESRQEVKPRSSSERLKPASKTTPDGR